MDEMFEPRKKEKLDKGFFKSFIFMFIIGLFLVLGTSYSLEFFKANKNVGTIRLNTSAIDITVTGDNTINQSLTKYPDNEGITSGLKKSFHITNENNSIGRILLKLERTSGVELSNIKYALSVNDIIIKVSNIPSDGIIFDEVMLGEEELDVKVTLWADNDYTGSLDFNGTITNEMKRTNTTANDVLEEIIDYDNILTQTNNYVRFNNELYRIVKEEDNRLVICKNADFDSTALTRVNSNKFNSSLTYTDNSIIYSHSTDSKNLYLVETVNIKSGRGTETEPFVLENTRKNFDDKKVTAYITYQDDNNQTLFTQPIYYDEINYIGYTMNDPGFIKWTDNTNDYNYGDIITFTTDKELMGVVKKTAFSTIAKQVDRTTQINFGNNSSDTNGKGVYEIKDDNNNSIYYYRGAVTNNNVIFGDFCWLMVRTTDTGGVKMIYNGVATDNGTTCTNATGTARQISSIKFNTNYESMSDVGYMYNKRYSYRSRGASIETMLSSDSLNTTYWYADSVTWGSPTANKYNLDNPYQVSATTDYPNLVGKYTFKNTSQTYTNTYVYYIAAVNNTTMYYIQLPNAGNHTLADFNYTYTYGDGYTDLGNGTYEITDATSVTTINRSDWYTSYSNLKNKFVCKNATNNTCNEVWYVTGTSKITMSYLKVSNIKFFNGINNYDSTTGTYTLDNDNFVSFWDITNSTNKTSLNTHHYTCWNESGTCTTLSYIYYVDGTAYYYINLTGGELVEDALYKMTGNAEDTVKNREINQNYELNTTDSTAKAAIEAWFKTNLTNEEDATKENYQTYLEDIVFCNDRKYKQTGRDTFALSGWNPNGGSVTSYIEFNTSTRLKNNNWYSTTNKPTFNCPNETDRFSVSNEKAKLKYPVGLLTADEIVLAGSSGNEAITNPTYYLYNGSTYNWSLSPSYFGDSRSREFIVDDGNISSFGGVVDTSNGLRPVVSLKSGTEFVDGGEGTPTNPYVVKYNS